ncbi:hypothetical protein BaRGS_00024559 [Batillaria attramentaria]|uniref:Uncharacterized protein n=1 Tax=Batillaria attramentaria TaxID=370345 RepID=A0ABD0KAS6_9CAEN
MNNALFCFHLSTGARFEFPTLNGTQTLTVKENANVTLPFQLLNVDCQLPPNFSIRVQENDSNDHCVIHHRRGKCVQEAVPNFVTVFRTTATSSHTDSTENHLLFGHGTLTTQGYKKLK